MIVSKQVIDTHGNGRNDRLVLIKRSNPDTFRYYDAVGPATMSMLEMLSKFARFQGNDSFRPIFIDYRNMERMLNVKSLGNLNRQFVSLLRSEQETSNPVIGDATVWERVLGEDGHLLRLEDAFAQNQEGLKSNKFRRFPYFNVLLYVAKNPRVIGPGILLSAEIISAFARSVIPGLSSVRTEVQKK